MNIGEVNKGAVVLIVALLLGAGGYLWYSMLYKPAVATRTQALATEKTAQDELAAAKSRLEAAEQQLAESKKAGSAVDDSVARLQLSRKAVPEKKLIDDAAIVLMSLARRSDIRTSFLVGGDSAEPMASAPIGNLSGATPIDLTFEAAGTYREMMLFMSSVEDTVVEEDGKIHARDRLFNVVKLEIGEDEEASSTSAFSDETVGGEADPNELVAGKGEILFTVTVRMYTSSTQNANSVGGIAPDAAAAPLDGAGGAAGTGAGAADVGAGGTNTATTPNAGGAATTTTPAAGGATDTTGAGGTGGATGTGASAPAEPAAATPAAGGGV